MKFLDFLKDATEMVQPFNKVITHIQIAPNKDGTLRMVAPSSNRSVEIHATSLEPISDFNSRACLGTIPYLSQLLSNDLMKSANPIFNITEHGEKDYLKSIELHGKKLDVFYSATNPFIGSIIKPHRTKDMEWPVAFAVDEGAVTELKHVQRLGMSSGANTDELFSLSCYDDAIRTQFGGSSHSVDYTLSNTIEYLGKTKTINPTLFYIDVFFRLMDVSIKNNAVIMFNDKALKFEFATPQNISYEIITTARKTQ
jgi:hypothetical protein